MLSLMNLIIENIKLIPQIGGKETGASSGSNTVPDSSKPSIKGKAMGGNVTANVPYIVGTTNDRIYQYNLSAAWDIATAVVGNNLSGLT